MSDALNLARYQWLRNSGACPFAETDQAWDSPDALDAAIDSAIAAEARLVVELDASFEAGRVRING